MSRAFLDTNIPIYAQGRSHPLKDPSKLIIEAAAQNPQSFLTSAEVLQELLHRYRALRMWPEPGKEAFDKFVRVTRNNIMTVTAEDVQRAADLADVHARLSARDLVHLAVMERSGATAIVTADTAFDNIDGVERLDPADAATWLPRFEDED